MGFFQRRGFRILPPYYAALVLSIAVDRLLDHFGGWTALIVSRPTVVDVGSRFTPPAPPNASMYFWDIMTHVTLVHNWFPHWNLSINPTHWSVATEVQIYLLFPFLLLPVWRRFGSLAVVLFGTVVGVLPLLLFPLDQTVTLACPQFAGLFTFGMAAAVINFSQRPQHVRLRLAVPWGGIAILLFCVFVAISKVWATGIPSDGQVAIPQPWTMDLLIGMAAGCLIVSCTRYLTQGEAGNKPVVLRLFESDFATRLGAFSYSIYLMHLPIIFGFRHLFLWADPYDFAPLLMMSLVGLPTTLFLCYLFHLAFERRFMRNLSLPKRVPGELFLSARD